MVVNWSINAFQSLLALSKYNLALWKIHSKMICWDQQRNERKTENSYVRQLVAKTTNHINKNEKLTSSRKENKTKNKNSYEVVLKQRQRKSSRCA
ncbi:CLUMA_CG006182, isoform A [Clunio marinus]|uniref:CLUMA_CG006182, isoform A n=1 Tax=Clunio marinus TaxID=568069 RepID=A0A1J1HX21_9DIPT|nr:CLUMA_CG006182, isoform A [Clunio marinus]